MSASERCSIRANHELGSRSLMGGEKIPMIADTFAENRVSLIAMKEVSLGIYALTSSQSLCLEGKSDT